ncbi:MAG: hypothetical protein KDC30_00345 [Saprospiraceae bacterium]|nr:hypothetical protein [Saprospiraceae bacterium]
MKQQQQIIALPHPQEWANFSQGENRKQLLVVSGDELPATEEQIDFLQKILSAVQHDLQQDALFLNTTRAQRLSFTQICRATPVQNTLVFGLQPAELGLHWRLPPYRVFRRQERAFLFADPLRELQQNQELKRQLWEALQAMFKPESK